MLVAVAGGVLVDVGVAVNVCIAVAVLVGVCAAVAALLGFGVCAAGAGAAIGMLVALATRLEDGAEVASECGRLLMGGGEAVASLVAEVEACAGGIKVESAVNPTTADVAKRRRMGKHVFMEPAGMRLLRMCRRGKEPHLKRRCGVSRARADCNGPAGRQVKIRSECEASHSLRGSSPFRCFPSEILRGED